MNITIEGVEYEVAEVTMGLLRRINKEFSDTDDVGYELAKRIVYVAGSSDPIGDGFDDLNVAVGNKLLSFIAEMNNREVDSSGN